LALEATTIGSRNSPGSITDVSPVARFVARPALAFCLEEVIMAVARGDEGSTNVTNNPGPRRRVLRKTVATAPPVDGHSAPPPAPPPPPPIAATPPTAPPAPLPTPNLHPNATRLDDLYRLPMPKLFVYAEREGISEHTGMNRGQLIMAVVRRQIER